MSHCPFRDRHPYLTSCGCGYGRRPGTRTDVPDVTGAGRLRNHCAFTSRDMGADWTEAFTYAVVFGWDAEDSDGEDGAMDEMAARWGWDETLVEFLRDAHRRFQALPATKADQR